MNYQELKQIQRKRVNEFPMRFAFNDAQFQEILDEWEIDRNEMKDKLYKIPGGGFIRKTDSDALAELVELNAKEMRDAIKDDEFLTEALEYELANHEYCITYDPADALDVLGLDPKRLTAREKDCLKKAKERYWANLQ